MVISGVIAVVIGYPTLRLRGHYLAMATFALGLITYELSVEWIGLTQGYMGYAGIPPLGVGKYELTSDRQQLIALVLVLLLGVWIAHRLRDSRFGRALRAIAGSEAAANALGIDIARYKLAAFVVAAVYASVAGSLFAHFIGFISPEVFGLSMVTLSFTMLYLGGIGTIWGPIIGAVIVSMLPELFRGLKELQDIAYASVLILILIFFPKGLAALPGMLWRRRDEAKTGGRLTLLSVSNVTKRFGGLLANDAISFEVPEKTVFAVIGPNGAGKTTLFNAISGFFPPTEGRIVFDGDDITGLPQRKIAARGLVRTYQLVQLFKDLTVAENVQVGFHLVTRGAIGAALLRPRWVREQEARIRDETHDLLAFVGPRRAGRHARPTPCPTASSACSRSRARSPRKPRLLLLDEPAAGLNPDETQALADTILRIRERGITVLLIEHDMSLVMRIAQHIVVLDFGKKIAEGTPDEIKAASRRDRRLSRHGGGACLTPCNLSRAWSAASASA